MIEATTLAGQTLERARIIGRGMVNVVLPPRCIACGAVVEEHDALCGRCWAGLTFFAPPWCASCGLPFPFPTEEGAVCGNCARGHQGWDRARSAIRYGKDSRGLVLGLKHADHTHLARAFGKWMSRAGGELLREADLLVPVPLHWSRLFYRRYNQAALLANAISRAGGPKVAVDCLVRHRKTPSQGHLGALARERNVRGAFTVLRPDQVAKRRVVIIDDVMTTGATVAECARLLKRAGAEWVGVLTLARALRIGA